ncbi:hypothetical protein HDU82_003762 [Entophlyctis luteolus]|nr:hypothetical protein HDU82_003762 [Entophlyctis luteolus]
MRLLWANAIRVNNGNPDLVSSSCLDALWNQLVHQGKVSAAHHTHQKWPNNFTEATWNTYVESIITAIAGKWMVDSRGNSRGVSRSATDETMTFSNCPFKITSPAAGLKIENLVENSDNDPSEHENYEIFSMFEVDVLARTFEKIRSSNYRLEYFEDGEWKSTQSTCWQLTDCKKPSSKIPIPITLAMDPQHSAITVLPETMQVHAHRNREATCGAEINANAWSSNCLIPIAAEPPKFVESSKMQTPPTSWQNSRTEKCAFFDCEMTETDSGFRSIDKELKEPITKKLKRHQESCGKSYQNVPLANLTPQELDAVLFLQKRREQLEANFEI